MSHESPPPDQGDADDCASRFEQWTIDHLPALYRVAYRFLGDVHDAEDVLQDTFRSAWSSRHLYQASRSERAWLLGILRRRVADHWRRRGAGAATLGDAAEGIVAPPGPEPLADELSASMQRALGTLPGELRETLLLVVVGELTHQEAADLQGIPLGTVLSRVSRARARLRECLRAAALPRAGSSRASER
ncbi:MAG: sigma-70 family RNA polymerase sigma factor [Planctomycetia bacterium]|nr:sigma-70 family RNA polymerase sigma factor [Planctomycetia bacterium]